MIHKFLNWLLFASTMFAAAPVVVGGGASSGAGAGNSGEAGAGSGGGADKGGAGGDGGRAIPGADKGGDSRTVEGGDLGRGAGADASADDFGEVGDFETPDAEEMDAAGSADEFGPEVYKTVKEALKAHPNEFKAIKKAVSMVKRYQEHFESPEAAGELLTSLSTLGGIEAIQQEMGETATFLNGWNAGDEEVVKSWLKENGDGLGKNMPTVLDAWRESDPDGWAHDAARTFKATMLSPNAKTGLSPVAALQQLGEIEGVKDSPAYKTLMERIQGVIARADQAPEQPAAKGPDDAKLTAREQKIREQEWNVQRQMLGGKAAPLLQTSAQNALKLVAGNRKLSPQATKDLIGDMHREFARVVEKMDPSGKEKRQKLLAAGQSEQWLKLVHSAAARYMPIAARNVWRKYAGISGLSAQQKTERRIQAGQQKETGSGGAGGAVLEKKSPGDGRQVDRDAMRAKFGSRDKADDAFLFGLKETGGKKVWIEKVSGKMFTY